MSAIQTNSDIPIAASTVAELVALQPQPDGSIVYLESQALFYVQVYVLPPGVVTSPDGSSGAIAGRTVGTYWVQLALLLGALLPTGGGVRRARGVVNVFVADLTHFRVTGAGPTDNDGIVFVEGDTVLLIGQFPDEGPDLGYENGPYIVGHVTDGYAPLTRPSWYPTGSAQKFGGVPIEIGCEGVTWGNNRFRAMGFQSFGLVVAVGDAYTVDTDDPGWYSESTTMETSFTAGVLEKTFPIFSSWSVVNMTTIPGQSSSASYDWYYVPGGWGLGYFAIVARTSIGDIDTNNNVVANLEVVNRVWTRYVPPT